MTTVLFDLDGKTEATTYAPPETPTELGDDVALTIEAFANPWRDERGRFAEKGYAAMPAARIGERFDTIDKRMTRQAIDTIFGPRLLAGNVHDRRFAQFNQKREQDPGYKGEDDFEKDLAALQDGNNRRLNHWAKKMVEQDAAGVEYETDPEKLAFIDQALADTADNAAMKAAVDLYGEIPVLAVKDGTLGGSYRYSHIQISGSFAKSRAEAEGLTVGGYLVDRSLAGTVRHEYGHHVEKQMKATPAGVAAYEGFRETYRVWKSSAPKGEGLSDYARKTAGEGWAETFAFVTHSSFDYDRISSGPMKDMVDVVLDTLDPDMGYGSVQ
jgi:hypothetical protein